MAKYSYRVNPDAPSLAAQFRSWGDETDSDYGPARQRGFRSPVYGLRGLTSDPADGYSADERRRHGRKLDYPQHYPNVAVRREIPARPSWDDTRDPYDPLWAFSPGELPAVLEERDRREREGLERTWATEGGTVRLADGVKTFTGACAECGGDFSVERPASQSRRWPTTCPDCVQARKRRLTAERVRRHRAQKKSAA